MNVTTRIGWRRDRDDEAALLTREWLLTNGLGGYASGTLGGAPTRRYHGLLVAALPQPLGRTLMLNQLTERVDGAVLAGTQLSEFRLEDGLPVWTFALGDAVIEKRVLLAHLQNTVFVQYRLLQGAGGVRLSLQPSVHFRPHDDAVSSVLGAPYALSVVGERYEISAAPAFPPLRLALSGEQRSFVCEPRRQANILYAVEADRGYDSVGEQWSLGHFRVTLTATQPATLIAGCESWEDLTALSPEEAFEFERERREHLVAVAGIAADDALGRELVFAADQFVIAPRGRVAAATRAHARGEELRTVIAGYHWFTDWGRDTMISFEGLFLQTGRHQEGRYVLHMFSQYVREGLIPNLFPERTREGLYHTADATLWFFHAVDRYVAASGDRQTLRELLPVLQDIVAWHLRGTSFGIGVDASDGLLRQGAEGYQLTWMDAKCDGWVVTPRRGKAVEINALWYNALCNLAGWLREESQPDAAAALEHHAQRVESAFNARFVSDTQPHLYDVVDGEDGRADPALRPNQLFAISLPHPVLRREHWQPVLQAATEALLTPVGLRSLARNDPEYKPSYHGDLRTRDAAYHQGTVWSWLIGPFADAWSRVYPGDREQLRAELQGLIAHLNEACIGSVSEVFDAEPPYTARGCIAQAWGVAELLRVWRLAQKDST